MKQLAFIALFFTLFSCKTTTTTEQPNPFGLSDINSANRKLLEVAMEDGFPPPIASRVYAYPHIAHYIALSQFYPDSLPSIEGNLNGMTPVSNLNKENAHPELTSLLAFCKTAKKVIFSEHYMDAMVDSIKLKAQQTGISADAIAASVTASDSIAQHMFKWIANDNYVQTRTMDRFTASKDEGLWKETPPDYVPGLESHWMKIRPMVIDSASCYAAATLPPYDQKKDSEFYKMVDSVYQNSKNLSDEQKEIAWFWDDNPNVSEHRGHLVVMVHKISPPGHWLNIIHQISERENSSLIKATKAYTFTAIAMFDSVISCWYEKYKTNLVRPITYIQENIDVNWKPLIQTPPFPEYTSGHSAISASAATVLSDIYGDNYAFTDSTEVLFEQPVRSFTSFQDAAWEVSLSRFYAGIHYMNGIREGNKQGKYIGRMVLDKLK
ncbi:MAG: vanadium-dependent haloperoxidase [Saprospiraceae bacterium]